MLLVCDWFLRKPASLGDHSQKAQITSGCGYGSHWVLAELCLSIHLCPPKPCKVVTGSSSIRRGVTFQLRGQYMGGGQAVLHHLGVTDGITPMVFTIPDVLGKGAGTVRAPLEVLGPASSRSPFPGGTQHWLLGRNSRRLLSLEVFVLTPFLRQSQPQTLLGS